MNYDTLYDNIHYIVCRIVTQLLGYLRIINKFFRYHIIKKKKHTNNVNIGLKAKAIKIVKM